MASAGSAYKTLPLQAISALCEPEVNVVVGVFHPVELVAVAEMSV